MPTFAVQLAISTEPEIDIAATYTTDGGLPAEGDLIQVESSELEGGQHTVQVIAVTRDAPIPIRAFKL